MSSLKTPKSKLLDAARSMVPTVHFAAKNVFYWSPEHQTVAYDERSIDSDEGRWSLFHEVAHAKLEHVSYSSDFELLKLEVAAWEQAKLLAQEVFVSIDPDHIQDCLDSYRDWLHQRSTCPTCGSVGLQHTPKEYYCHNCLGSWTVSESRFCRPYRRKVLTSNKKTPSSVKSQAKFH